MDIFQLGFYAIIVSIIVVSLLIVQLLPQSAIDSMDDFMHRWTQLK